MQVLGVDKTGTLTTGQFEVQQVAARDGFLTPMGMLIRHLSDLNLIPI